MKANKLITIAAIAAIVLMMVSQVYASSLYEYYNTGNDAYGALYSVNWKAQTFTVNATGHTITSVKLLLEREEGVSPGTFTASIRATNVTDGHPTGDDLTNGTIDGNTVSESATWYEINLTEYTLSASTKYAIVARVVNWAEIYWLKDNSSPTYDGGNAEVSSNSGSTWSSTTDSDHMFEVWGSELPPPPPPPPESGLISGYAKIMPLLGAGIGIGMLVLVFAIVGKVRGGEMPISIIILPLMLMLALIVLYYYFYYIGGYMGV